MATPHVSHRYPTVSATTTTASGATVSVKGIWEQGARSIVISAPSTTGIVGVPVEDSLGCGLSRFLVDGVETLPTTLASATLGSALTYRAALPATHVFSPQLTPGMHTVVTCRIRWLHSSVDGSGGGGVVLRCNSQCVSTTRMDSNSMGSRLWHSRQLANKLR